MLNNATGFEAIYIATGYTDLRCGIDGFATLIKTKFGIDPFVQNTLFLFCGRNNGKIKGLIWEGDGFLLLYKRLEEGRFQWPRNEHEAMKISQDQFDLLMKGFTIVPTIKQVSPKSTF